MHAYVYWIHYDCEKLHNSTEINCPLILSLLPCIHIGLLNVSKQGFFSRVISLDPLVFAIACVTTGGPATTVTVARNGYSIRLSQEMLIRNITDYQESTYFNEMQISQYIIAGVYQIRVSNNVSSVTTSFDASGIIIAIITNCHYR